MSNTLNKSSSEQCCAYIPDKSNGITCGSTFLDKDILSFYGVKVCKRCKFENDDYDCITKTEATSKYLLPPSTIAMLKHQPKVNPNHPNWAPLQLYLRMDVKEAAVVRFGSLELLEMERTKREEKKFQRNVKEMDETLSLKSQEFKEFLQSQSCTGVEDAHRLKEVAQSTPSVADKRKGKDSAVKSNSLMRGGKAKIVGNKRKSSALLDMISCIKGTDTAATTAGDM